MTPFQKEKILSGIEIRAVRSGGKGGQHVNKVSTKIEIRFDVRTSDAFTEDERKMVLKKLKSKLTENGELIITSQTSRSQWKNKEEAKEKLIELIQKSLVAAKKRIASKPSKSAKEKRLKEKKLHSEIKSGRRIKIVPSE